LEAHKIDLEVKKLKQLNDLEVKKAKLEVEKLTKDLLVPEWLSGLLGLSRVWPVP
jgi:hypothetical protein